MESCSADATVARARALGKWGEGGGRGEGMRGG